VTAIMPAPATATHPVKYAQIATTNRMSRMAASIGRYTTLPGVLLRVAVDVARE
jgi:hypothetical protein